MTEVPWIALLGATALKLLLLPAYHSTDFEVHRNWMALTATLPPREWYLDQTSEWTLDYPPLFAWFERFLAVGARLVDPQILTLSSTPYISHTTLGYQRATVIASDIVLLLGCRRFANAISSSTTASTTRTSTSTSTTASAASILSFLN